VHDALSASKRPFKAPASPAAAPDLGLDTAAIDDALGFKGRNSGHIYAVGVQRSDEMKADRMVIPGAMGTAIDINFQPSGAGKAAITGDFVALASEVVPLLKALRGAGIDVTAVHNNMLEDEPRAFAIHFWANDDAVKLAKRLRAALDAVHVAKKGRR
jgi:hypothetical protein